MALEEAVLTIDIGQQFAPPEASRVIAKPLQALQHLDGNEPVGGPEMLKLKTGWDWQCG